MYFKGVTITVSKLYFNKAAILRNYSAQPVFVLIRCELTPLGSTVTDKATSLRQSTDAMISLAAPTTQARRNHFHCEVLCASGGLEQTEIGCGISHVREPMAPAASPPCSQPCPVAKRKQLGPGFSRAPFLQSPILGSERLSRPLLSQPARLSSSL